MSVKNLKIWLLAFVLTTASLGSFAQDNVPYGINYQAVARDNFGKELTSKDIDVKFSIIKETPLGTMVYQELYSHVTTSKYGVFSLVIGKGTATGGIYSSFSEIDWSKANHFLKVEVKFENDFIDMGTMQFLAVPYALYAQKSLEPGPAGPKGDKGDPASDNQYLSYIGDTLSISNGNKVGLTNQLQDLVLDVNNKLKITKNASATAIDLTPFKQDLAYNNTTGLLGISNGASADLSALKTDAIQDIHLTGNQLTIDKNASSVGVDLTKYMDNTDNQQLAYSESSKLLSISGGNSVPLGTLIAFRAKKITSETVLSFFTDLDFITPEIIYNDGLGFDEKTGIFTAPVPGIYTFIIGYHATGPGSSRELKLYLNGSIYETLNNEIISGSYLTRSITIKLIALDKVKVLINTGGAMESGTGSFSGYKVY